MPQMSPIDWLFLFIMTLMIFLMFIMMTYYSTLSISPKLKIMKLFDLKSYTWKW